MGRSKYKKRSGKGGVALNNWKKIIWNKILENIEWKSINIYWKWKNIAKEVVPLLEFDSMILAKDMLHVFIYLFFPSSSPLKIIIISKV